LVPTHCTLFLQSGVARVPGGQKLFLHPHQQKMQSLKWKIGAKARKKQKQNIYYVLLLLLFEVKNTFNAIKKTHSINLYQ